MVNTIKISLASPEKILEWSHGEVKTPETINYRTSKMEEDGLFCPRIFGPVKNYECTCGKYTHIKHRGVVCEKCGVEVTLSKVRRERMGHIKLAAPVAHIWFWKLLPSRIRILLDIPLKNLERVLYFDAYAVIFAEEDVDLFVGQLLSKKQYRESLENYPGQFKAGIGAETIREMLKNLDLPALSEELRQKIEETGSMTKRRTYGKRLNVVEAFRDSGNRPEWMILEVIPVLPPDLRPLVLMDDGDRFVTSDLNDLYRRVINRNNRLKEHMENDAPDIIIHNEKRQLQEAIDALFDNGRRGNALTGRNKKPLKSFSDLFKGKKGRFRQNLLGKRVDYSGRSVIVVGPHLRLHQCGLPKKMALELFKPFIYNKLESKGLVTSVYNARKMVEKGAKEVWDILDDIVREYPVILNRAPTLHRLGMQAFEVVLTEDEAIQLHPLVCTAFNADFDGDQMAVHLPLSVEAQVETRVLMMSSDNILSPANGDPIILPSKDIILGLYYMTRARVGVAGEGMVFSDTIEARIAYDHSIAHLQARVKVRIQGELVNTTIGRILVGELLPEAVPFTLVNKELSKKNLALLINYTFLHTGTKETVILADRLKDLGFEQATRAGISICTNDMKIPADKEKIVKESENAAAEVDQDYKDRLITNDDKYKKHVNIWLNTTDKITRELEKDMAVDYVPDNNGKLQKLKSFNSIYIMADSGAHGSMHQISQLAGMRGMVFKPSGEIMETPVKSNFREGLTALEYFSSSNGARKGLGDRSLNTGKAGYLTRRLVNAAHSSIVVEKNCETTRFSMVKPLIENGQESISLGERILGRVASDNILDPQTGQILVEKNDEITEDKVKAIQTAGINQVKIRSVLTCEAKGGVCALCYGRDLARGYMVNIGEAVGVIAAQSVGEPGTQLTMKTFHTGGTASRSVDQADNQSGLSGGSISSKSTQAKDITGGLPRINELFEARSSEDHAIVTEIDGRVGFGRKTKVKNRIIITPDTGTPKEYLVPKTKCLTVQEGDYVNAGDILTDGSVLLNDILYIKGEMKLARFLMNEIQTVYRLQGVKINDKHFEIIIRQMLKWNKIIDPGDTRFMFDQQIEKWELYEENNRVIEKGLQSATAEPLLLSITKVSRSSDSFISAASFQYTSKVLINAAMAGKIDYLTGVQKNVIIGKLINAGTGFQQTSYDF